MNLFLLNLISGFGSCGIETGFIIFGASLVGGIFSNMIGGNMIKIIFFIQ